jgi:hypothetical protein
MAAPPMRHSRHGSTLVCLALIALVAALLTSTGSTRAHARASASAAVPDTARAAVSRALGVDQRAYWPRHLRGGRHSGLPSRFGRDGVTLSAGEHRAALQLQAIGRGDDVRVLPAAAPRTARNRVSYDRGGVREWYADGPLGLEQGFTLRDRPGAGSGPLALDVAVRGLRARLDRDALGATLVDRGGRPVLRYAGLAVTDADGHPVRAWMERRAGAVRIHVADTRAQYPLVVDPFVTIATLTDGDAQTSEQLGSSVAIDGDTIVAGAPFAGNQGSNSKGAIYVFVKPASGWANATQTAKLEKAGTNNGERLGQNSVSIDGDTVVGGTQQAGSAAGPVYLFQRPGGGWAGTINPTAALSRSDGTDFTKSLTEAAISGDTVVAAAGHSSGSNSAFVFVRGVGGWSNATESATLVPTDSPCCQGNMGWSLAIDGNTIALGNPQYNTPANGSGTTTGRVDVYVKPGGGWAGTVNQTARIFPSDAASGDEFGEAVAVEGDTIVAGAPDADISGQADQGAAYVFQKPGGGWVDGTTQVAKLRASNGVTNDQLGSAVGIADDTIAVGSTKSGGSVYVFKRVGSTWTGSLTESAQASGLSSGANESEVAITPGGVAFRGVGGVLPSSTTAATIVAGAPAAGSNRGAAFVLGDQVTAPAVTTSAATGVGITGATLNGTVNPNGAATTYQFDYGLTTSYGSTAPVSPASAGSGSAAAPFSQAIGGLAPNTTYHFRLRATNSGGTTISTPADRTFTTAPALAPTGGTCDATNVGTGSATLCGVVNAQGTAVSDCHFEYGATTGYGTSVPCAPTPSGASDQGVAAGISGLQPGTTYHFRVVSTNPGGTLTSTDRTFTTGAASTTPTDSGSGGGTGGGTSSGSSGSGGGGGVIPLLPPPTTTGPAGNPLGLPSVRCLDTRKFTFRLHHPTATKIVSVDVLINGQRKLHKAGAAIESITLTRLPQQSFKVRITAVQDNGDSLVSERTYKGCTKSRAHGRHRRGKR